MFSLVWIICTQRTTCRCSNTNAAIGSRSGCSGIIRQESASAKMEMDATAIEELRFRSNLEWSKCCRNESPHSNYHILSSQWIMMLSWGGYIWRAEYLIVVLLTLPSGCSLSICVLCFLFFRFFLFVSAHFSPLSATAQSYILCQIGINYPNLLWCCSLCSYLLLCNIRFVSLSWLWVDGASGSDSGGNGNI